MLGPDRKSTRLNSSHTVIYTLSLHDALPIYRRVIGQDVLRGGVVDVAEDDVVVVRVVERVRDAGARSEEHTSELQSHRDLHSFPTRRSSDLPSRHRSGCPEGWRR